MTLVKPYTNNALIEVLKADDIVIREDDNELMKYGILRDARVDRFHLTASAAVDLGVEYQTTKAAELAGMIGDVVKWEEFAEGGQTFKDQDDNKVYALIPWWRIIGYKKEIK